MAGDLMTPPEVARYLGISKWLTYELLAKGQIPGQMKIGTRYRISRPKFLAGLDAAAEKGLTIGAERQAS